ncbi:MAG: HDOD domain-containing protein [Rhodocyclaceae bacterium]|nr:HDOD domain-containing protein [Rhodocyclaceae bacterium]
MSDTQDEQLSTDDLNQHLATLEIPVCPAIVMQVMAEAQKDEPDLRALAKTISGDVGMSALAIKLANSAAFSNGAPVTSVSQALARLGTRNVVCVVVAVALKNSVTGVPAAVLESFWNRTSLMAIAAGVVARHHYGIPPDLAYTYALFHDAAIPVMMRHFPDYQKVIAAATAQGTLLVTVEDQHFQCTHAIVGALLVRNWGLPSAIREAVRFHHDKDVYELPAKTLPSLGLSLIAVTHVAEHLASELRQEQDLDVGEAHFNQARRHLGIDDHDMEELREELQAALS